MKFSEVKIISFLTLKVIQTPFGLIENLGIITYLLMFIANCKKVNWILVLRMIYGSTCPGIIPSSLAEEGSWKSSVEPNIECPI